MVSIGILIVHQTLGTITAGTDPALIEARLNELIANQGLATLNPVGGIVDGQTPEVPNPPTYHHDIPTGGGTWLDPTTGEPDPVVYPPTTPPTTIVVTEGDNDNDVPLLNAILEELQRQTTLIEGNQSLTFTNETNRTEFDDSFKDSISSGTDVGFLDDMNPLSNITPTGTLPSTAIYVPSIQGGDTRVEIDLNDPTFAPLFAVAKAGLSALIVITSFRGTAWSAAQILTS